MPKSLYVDPVELRAPATIHFDDIPVNAYNRTVSDERAKYGDVLANPESQECLPLS